MTYSVSQLSLCDRRFNQNQLADERRQLNSLNVATPRPALRKAHAVTSQDEGNCGKLLFEDESDWIPHLNMNVTVPERQGRDRGRQIENHKRSSPAQELV